MVTLHKKCVLFRTTNRSEETKPEIVQDVHLVDERNKTQEVRHYNLAKLSTKRTPVKALETLHS
jgi:hypothetical protein